MLKTSFYIFINSFIILCIIGCNETNSNTNSNSNEEGVVKFCEKLYDRYNDGWGDDYYEFYDEKFFDFTSKEECKEFKMFFFETFGKLQEYKIVSVNSEKTGFFLPKMEYYVVVNVFYELGETIDSLTIYEREKNVFGIYYHGIEKQ